MNILVAFLFLVVQLSTVVVVVVDAFIIPSRIHQSNTISSPVITPSSISSSSKLYFSMVVATMTTTEEQTEKKKKDVRSVLESLSSENGTGVSFFETETVATGDITEWKKAYFVKDPEVRFRHEGSNEKDPKVVFLQKEDRETDQVYVYYSASGSGKTVELGASSVTRNADFTLLLKIRGDITEAQINQELTNTDEYTGDDKDDDARRARNKVAFVRLRNAVSELMGRHPTSIKKILESASTDGLKIVVALDEASTYPLIVRSIISERVTAQNFLQETVFKGINVRRVFFSIAGTGVATTSTGSDGKNFRHLKTSAVKQKFLYPIMSLKESNIELTFPGETNPTKVTMQRIRDGLPILSCMMENARMASIALKLLKETSEDTKKKYRPIEEGDFLDKVARAFIKSNGLQSLNTPLKKRVAAACAFAIMLFQYTTEDNYSMSSETELNEFVYKFKCGVQLDETVTAHLKSGNQEQVRKELVATYGLLEPNQEEEIKANNPVHCPFIMPPSQQLIALHLLGVDLALLVKANPYGFEVLSTHTMKVALAASSVVAWQTRKSVADTLKKVGCMVDVVGTHNDAKKKWKELDNLFIVCHDFGHGKNNYDDVDDETLLSNDWDDPENYSKTISLDAEVEIVPGTEGGDNATKTTLLIDNRYYDLLKLAGQTEHCTDKKWYPPITAINYGNSALSDGFITFFVAERVKVNDNNNNNNSSTIIRSTIRRFTLNQAKDKLGDSGKPKGPLPMKKIAANAEQCYNKVLDGLFGTDRLLVVSTPTQDAGLFAKKSVRLDRKWIPRVMEKCEILKNLMTTLAKQRCKVGRLETYTVQVDAEGNQVDSEGNVVQ